LEFLGKTQGRFGKKKKKQESGRKKQRFSFVTRDSLFGIAEIDEVA
jgi:hypothetical protein